MALSPEAWRFDHRRTLSRAVHRAGTPIVSPPGINGSVQTEEGLMKHLRLASAGCVSAVVGFVIAGSANLLAAGVSGAIFTTSVNGTRVNQNSFADKCDVYLDGGPGQNAPVGAAGLPDGDYYFQVTDPSGKTLLSTDAVQFRKFHVAGGIITGLAAPGQHGTGVDVDHNAVT